jgi:hypothetical protein
VINVDNGLKSFPIAFLLFKKASTIVVPLPHIGSKTISPSLVNNLIKEYGICGMNLAGYE